MVEQPGFAWHVNVSRGLSTPDRASGGGRLVDANGGPRAPREPSEEKLSRLPALDGLRALAIALVIGFHANLPGFRGGGLGVTIFFVLSGYLITGVLLKPGASTSQGLRRFYARRALRLFPALSVVVLFCVVYATAILHGHARSFLLLESLTSITYTTDFYLGRGRSTPDFGLLGHTWSLAIEEQFYLVWPWLLLLVVRGRRSAYARAGATLAFALLFTVWRAYLSSRHLAAHVGLNIDAQADCLLIGCSLALALPAARHILVARHQRLVTGAALLGMVFIVVMGASQDLHRMIPLDLIYLVVSLSTAAIIVRLVVPPQGAVSCRFLWLFSLRPVVWMGVVSYSLYLWHRVVFEVFRQSFAITTMRQRLEFGPLMLLLVFLAASASYYRVERPFLRLKDRFEERAERAELDGRSGGPKEQVLVDTP
jgi:peptidoglycan/LPS O-acetylase OafA/YrhL